MKNISRNRSGFTLIELVIVVWILGILLPAIAQIVGEVSARSSSFVQTSYTQVVTALQETLKRASFWYGGLALVKWVKDDVNLLPEDYVLYFRSGIVDDWNTGQMYKVQTQTRDSGGGKYTRTIGREPVEYFGNNVYLRKIIAKKDDLDWGVEIGSVGVSFKNPTGKTSFFLNTTNFVDQGSVVIDADKANTINEFPAMTADSTYNLLELEFDDLSGPLYQVKVYKDKRFPVKTYSLNP